MVIAFGIWCSIVYALAQYELAGPFVLLTVFMCLVYFGTSSGRQRKKTELSAYSVFNPNCVRLKGTFTAEQFENELLRRPLDSNTASWLLWWLVWFGFFRFPFNKLPLWYFFHSKNSYYSLVYTDKSVCCRQNILTCLRGLSIYFARSRVIGWSNYSYSHYNGFRTCFWSSPTNNFGRATPCSILNIYLIIIIAHNEINIFMCILYIHYIYLIDPSSC